MQDSPFAFLRFEEFLQARLMVYGGHGIAILVRAVQRGDLGHLAVGHFATKVANTAGDFMECFVAHQPAGSKGHVGRRAAGREDAGMGTTLQVKRYKGWEVHSLS